MNEQVKTWASACLSNAIYELMDRGVFDELLIEAKPAWALPETLVIGQARIKGNVNNFFWILCGDAPTLCIESSLAKNPRLALRHFSYVWQRDIGVATDDNAEQIKRAEALLDLTLIDELWSSALT